MNPSPIGTAWTTGVSAAAASDYICQSGDLNAKIKGLAAWLPSTAPSATAFFGVDTAGQGTRIALFGVDISSGELTTTSAPMGGANGGWQFSHDNSTWW